MTMISTNLSTLALAVALLLAGVAGVGYCLSRHGANPGRWLVVALVAGMHLSYFAVYLLTPYDLGWHLTQSLERLLVQLWPLSLLSVLYLLVSSDSPRCAPPPVT